MSQLIAKVRTHSPKPTYKLISDYEIFSLPDLSHGVSYVPDYHLEEEEWFRIDHFSGSTYCLELLKTSFNTVSFQSFVKEDIEKTDFFCSYQNGNEYFFQRVSTKFIGKKVFFANEFKIIENAKLVVINEYPDAIYLKNEDVLYFKSLSSINSIFKGINELYREATVHEVTEFLNNDFIELNTDFSINAITIPTRKRIALAINLLAEYDDEQKNLIFKAIEDYYPTVICSEEPYLIKIESEDDLKKVLDGIEQRCYTTIDGRKKKVANSSKTIE